MSEQEQSDDDSQKTEDPTPKRREEAERKGQLPISREVNTVFMLLAATLVVYYTSPFVSSGLSLYLKQFLEKTDQMTLSWESMTLLGMNIFLNLCKWLFMPFGIILYQFQKLLMHLEVWRFSPGSSSRALARGRGDPGL